MSDKFWSAFSICSFAENNFTEFLTLPAVFLILINLSLQTIVRNPDDANEGYNRSVLILNH